MKKVLILGTAAVGALALMSFGTKKKVVKTQPQPQPDPVYVPQVVIPDVVVPQVIVPDVVVPQVIIPDVVVPQVIIPDVVVVAPPLYQNKNGFELEIVKVNNVKYSGGKYVADVNLKISNWYDSPKLASEIKKIDITRVDTSSNLGIVPVNFNDISIPPNQSVVFANVLLSVSSYISSYIANRLKITPILSSLDTSIVIDAGNVVTSNQYIIKDKNILAYLTKRTSIKTNVPYADLGYDVVLENNTNEPFYLQDVKAIRISTKYGYGYEEVVVQPFNFGNVKIDSQDQTTLLDMVFSAPYKYDVRTKTFTKWTQRLIDVKSQDLNLKTKLELLF
jgi:hypothetical protein